MEKPKIKNLVKTQTAYELKLAVGYKLAAMVVMGSGLLVFTLFTTIWKLKV
jgi:hypothetical protein